MSSQLYKLFVSAATGLVFLAPLYGNSTCQKGYFFDHGTGRCESCWDICDAARIQRTEMKCARECPGYVEPGPKPQPPSGNDDTSAPLSANLSSPATAAIAIIAVGVAVCFIVLAAVKRNTIIRLWRWASNSLLNITEPTTTTDLPPGVPEVGDGAGTGASETSVMIEPAENCFVRRGQQESTSGRRGGQEQALIGSSAGSSINSESPSMEPKTFHFSVTPSVAFPRGLASTEV